MFVLKHSCPKTIIYTLTHQLFTAQLWRRNKEMLPDEDDMRGAAAGIVRLFSEYR